MFNHVAWCTLLVRHSHLISLCLAGDCVSLSFLFPDPLSLFAKPIVPAQLLANQHCIKLMLVTNFRVNKNIVPQQLHNLPLSPAIHGKFYFFWKYINIFKGHILVCGKA